MFAFTRQDFILILGHIHIVPFGKFHRIRGAQSKTFPNVKYDAPEEATENVLTVLLGNEVWSKFLM